MNRQASAPCWQVGVSAPVAKMQSPSVRPWGPLDHGSGSHAARGWVAGERAAAQPRLHSGSE